MARKLLRSRRGSNVGGSAVRWKLAAVFSALTLITACAGSAPGESSSSTKEDSPAVQKLIEAAKKEGALTYYSASTDEMNKALTDAFTAKYGIPVQTLRIATGGLLERFGGEQDSGVASADVLEVADEVVFGDKPEWFKPLSTKLLPELANYPKDAVHDNYVLLSISPAVITYNTDLVKGKDIPKGWKDLADPKWKGKILLTDPRTTPTYMGWAEVMKDLYGIGYLEKLKAQNFDLVQSATPGAQQVAAGAYAFNFPAATGHSAELRKQGAPVGIVIVQEGTNSPAQNASLVANAPHPNAAQLFLNFRLTQEGVEAVCAAAEATSPRKDVKGCIDTPKGWEPIPFEVWTDAAERAVLLGALGI